MQRGFISYLVSPFALGRAGGSKGGPARVAKMTPEEKSESAGKAVPARWQRAKSQVA